MSYLQDRKKKNKLYYKFSAFIFALFLFVFLGNMFFKQFTSVSNFLLVPVLRIGDRVFVNTKNWFALLQNKQNLIFANQSMEEKIAADEARLYNYQVLFNENEKLKEILLRKKTERQMVLASILVNPNKSPYNTLLIDAGRAQGVTVGNEVFAYGDIPIGQVVDVFDTSAKVKLYSTYGEKMSVVLSGSDTFVELIGRGRGNFEVVLPRDFDLAKGTLALLPGVNSYALAEVVDIISDPRDSSKKALLKSPVNISQLRFLVVVI